jgi:hypothetical protein
MHSPRDPASGEVPILSCSQDGSIAVSSVPNGTVRSRIDACVCRYFF